MRYEKIVLQYIKKYSEPFTIMDLQLTMGQHGYTPNKTTLYRLLDRFTLGGIVKNVMLNSGKSFYEYDRPENHHHHLICKGCNCIEPYILPKKLEAQILLNRNGWLIDEHNFELFGKCPKCQKLKK